MQIFYIVRFRHGSLIRWLNDRLICAAISRKLRGSHFLSDLDFFSMRVKALWINHLIKEKWISQGAWGLSLKLESNVRISGLCS